MQAGPFDRQRKNAGVPLDQRAEQGLDATLGQREVPERAFMPGIGRQRRAPRPVVMRSLQPDLRRDAVARGIDRAGVRHLAAGDDRDLLAQALGMGDDMGRENHRGALLGERADQPLELALVDRVEPGEGFVEHHQTRLVHEGAEQLHLLRHAFGELPDLPLHRIAQAVSFHQFAPALAAELEWQAAQRAHEGDRLVGLHRGVEPAFFGQVADQSGDVLRPLVAEQTACALVGIDDAEQHAQHRGLAGSIRAEHAVDRALGYSEIDPGHRECAVEPLDKPARFDGQRASRIAAEFGLA